MSGAGVSAGVNGSAKHGEPNGDANGSVTGIPTGIPTGIAPGEGNGYATGLPHGGEVRRLGYLSGAPRVSTRRDAEIGGPRAHILGVMSGFERIGWSVHPFIIGDRSPGVVARDAGKWLRKGRQWALLADVARIGLAPVNMRAAWRTLAGRVDWVYERYSVFQALGRPFARAGVPWILETNEMQSEEARVDRNSLVLTSLARRHERQAYLDCAMLVCVSEPLKSLVTERLGVPAEKVVVVPNGVDTTFFQPRADAPRTFEGFTIVYSGGLEPWQGIELLLRSIHAVREEDGFALHAVIAGDGPVRRNCEKLAAELGLAECVHFLGTVAREAVPAIIASGDVGYSGHTDSQGRAVFRSPLKLYEYMAMAKPIISSAVADAVDLVMNGETGYLFDAGSTDGLSQALRRAYVARERLPAMGARARQLIEQGHSWTARCRMIVESAKRVALELP
jgi:glycosyltransferase involved in cell wall biosynthesis